MRVAMSETHGTRQDGTQITDVTTEELAEEAERGYDVDVMIKARSGRSPVVSGPASVGPVRLMTASSATCCFGQRRKE